MSIGTRETYRRAELKRIRWIRFPGTRAIGFPGAVAEWAEDHFSGLIPNPVSSDPDSKLIDQILAPPDHSGCIENDSPSSSALLSKLTHLLERAPQLSVTDARKKPGGPATSSTAHGYPSDSSIGR